MCKGVGLVQKPEIMNGRMNVILSFVLTNLYAWVPIIQWYSVMSVGMIFLSLWGLLLAVQLEGTHRFFKMILLLFSCALYVYFFSSMQWTATASLAAMSAFFLLYSAYQCNRRVSGAFLCLPFLLMALSAGLRSDSFFLTCLLALPSVIFLLRGLERTPERRKLIASMAVAFIILLGGISFDKLCYESNPEWKKTMAFFHAHFNINEVRGNLYSYDTKPVFDSVGWTETDYRLLRGWYFLDETTYSVEKINRLCAALPRVGIEKRADETFMGMFLKQSTQCALLTCLALFFLIPSRHRGRAFIDVLWTLGVMFFLWTVFKLPARVYLPCLFFLVNLLLFRAVSTCGKGEIMKSPTPSDCRRNGVILGLILLVNVSFCLGFMRTDHRWGKLKDGFETSLKEFHPDPNKLYVVWEMLLPYNLIRPFDDYEVFRGWNIVSLTWLQRFPVTARMLERFGVKKLFRDMVDNPNIYLICNKAQGNLYQNYMLEKYGMKTELKAVYVSDYIWMFEVHRRLEDQPASPSKT
jgi:hypothetical protein